MIPPVTLLSIPSDSGALLKLHCIWLWRLTVELVVVSALFHVCVCRFGIASDINNKLKQLLDALPCIVGRSSARRPGDSRLIMQKHAKVALLELADQVASCWVFDLGKYLINFSGSQSSSPCFSLLGRILKAKRWIRIVIRGQLELERCKLRVVNS